MTSGSNSAKYLVKIGGSLVYVRNGEALRELLAALGRAVREASLRLALVPGGGPFAESVRHWSAVLGVGEEASHFMALKAMDQYGYVLHHFMPGSRILELAEVREPKEAFRPGAPAVLLCASSMMKVPPSELPRSWNATSDSIAAYLAGRLGAEVLVLVKAAWPSPARVRQMVDPCFPKLVPPSVEPWVVHGLDPDLVVRVILGQVEEGRGAVRYSSCSARRHQSAGRGVAW